MNKISLTFFTIVVGVLLVGVFLQMEKPSFKIENKFIVVSQNSAMASDMNHIINNIVNIANEQQESDLVKNFRARVKVERLAETSMFKISVLAQNEKEVKELNDRVIYRVYEDISKYYQVSSDVKIDSLKKSEVIKDEFSGILPIIFWILVGILISILVVMVVEIIIPKEKSERKIVIDFGNKNGTEKNVDLKNTKNDFSKIKQEVPVYDLKSSLEKKEVNLKYEFFNSFQRKNNLTTNDLVNSSFKGGVLPINSQKELMIGFSDFKNFEEKRPSFVDRSSNNLVEDNLNNSSVQAKAPINLPITSSFKENSNLQELEKNNSQTTKLDEPTEEELKERLNKLLSGKF